jgi:hypothetical protein
LKYVVRAKAIKARLSTRSQRGVLGVPTAPRISKEGDDKEKGPPDQSDGTIVEIKVESNLDWITTFS